MKQFISELKIVLRVAKWEFILKFITSILLRGILLMIPVLFSIAINDVTNQEIDRALFLIVISLIITAIYRLLECINQYTFYKLYNKIFVYYHKLALTKTNDNSLFSLSRFSPGQYTNIVISDVDVISSFFSNGVIRVVQVVEFLVIYIYFFSLDIYIFISAVVLSIMMLLFSLRSGRKVQKLSEKRKNHLDRLTSSSYDFFGGIREIKSFNIFDKLSSLTLGDTEKYLDSNALYNIKFNCDNNFFLFMFEALRLLSIVYAILFLVKNGLMEVGSLLLIYNYYQKIIDNFSTILTINVEYRNLLVSLQRFNQVVEYSRNKKRGLIIDKKNVIGNITFSNVLYGFRSNPTLEYANFLIPANSITVLFGKDEAAQNGIFDLLLKLNRQHEGVIQIDGIDINEIDDDCYFQIVSSVRRQTVFFDVSIRSNLSMINPDFKKIVKVCKTIGLDREIKKLENGYDTILTETTPISQSTKELLVIARLLLKESKILLFDDLIHTLSDESEKKVLELLHKLKKDHTIVVIGHSRELLSIADHTMDVSEKKVIRMEQ